MLKLFLWLRYLRKKKIVFLSIAAVALSVSLLIVVASLFGGFIDAVEKTGREAFGDIYLNPWLRIPDSEVLVDRLQVMPQVEAATSVLSAYGLLRLDAGNVRAVRVLGVDIDKYTKIAYLKESLLQQKTAPGEPTFALSDSPQTTGGFVGIGVLGKPDEETDRYDFDGMKSWLGKEVILTTGAVVDAGPDSDSAEQHLRRRLLKFRIADVVFTGMYMRDDEEIYLPIEQVKRLLSYDVSEATGPHEVIQVKLAETVNPETMLGPVREVWEQFANEHNLPAYSISGVLLSTSAGMQEFFVDELKKQLAVLMLIFGVVCSVAVLLIFCIFYMIIMTKQRDIAIVKSCGAPSGSVISIFLGFGVFVGIVGSILGTILAYVVTKNINTIEEWVRVLFGLKLWKSSVYVFEKIPSRLDVGAACWIVLFAVVAAAIGALLPAIVAARTRPVQILRYE